jgi:hypothetical protein
VQPLSSIRLEILLLDGNDIQCLLRWFNNLGVGDLVRNATTSAKHQDRLVADEVAARFSANAREQPKLRARLSSEQLSMDGMLLDRHSPSAA